MPRNVFYRDFTICKAVALAGLIGLSVALGGVPDSKAASAGADMPEAHVIPAMLLRAWTDCDSEKTGIAL